MRSYHRIRRDGGADDDGDDNDDDKNTFRVGLGWIEWILALAHVVHDTLFQRLYARHLPARLPLPDLSTHTCIVTGATSGIGLETAK